MGINQILRTKLRESAEEEYKRFHESLVPGLTDMLGVRMPKVREIARWAAKQDWQARWNELSNECYEELMIKGLLIGYGELSQKEQTEYLKRYIPLINNWAVCDCCCSTWKFMKEDRGYWFEFLQSYLHSEREFEVRFAVVAMLDYYILDEYIGQLFDLFDLVSHEGYYVKMAVAWAVSICYIKYPEQTWQYLEKRSLDTFTHNKAIQKIRESYRVSNADKEKLLGLRRNS